MVANHEHRDGSVCGASGYRRVPPPAFHGGRRFHAQRGRAGLRFRRDALSVHHCRCSTCTAINKLAMTYVSISSSTQSGGGNVVLFISKRSLCTPCASSLSTTLAKRRTARASNSPPLTLS